MNSTPFLDFKLIKVFSILLIQCILKTLSVEEGFELLFQTNDIEYKDLEFTLRGHVPKWLTGRLVSCFFLFNLELFSYYLDGYLFLVHSVYYTCYNNY